MNARQHFDHDQANGKDIGGGCWRVALELLGAHIGGRPHPSPRLRHFLRRAIVAFDSTSDAEIEQFDDEIVRIGRLWLEANIGGFEVAMDDAIAMSHSEPVEHLEHQRFDVEERELLASFDVIVERFALDKLHHVVERIGIDALLRVIVGRRPVIENSHDMRIVELFANRNLALKPHHGDVVIFDLMAQRLDGDDAIHLFGVDCAIDDAKPTATDDAFDAVAPLDDIAHGELVARDLLCRIRRQHSPHALTRLDRDSLERIGLPDIFRTTDAMARIDSHAIAHVVIVRVIVAIFTARFGLCAARFGIFRLRLAHLCNCFVRK